MNTNTDMTWILRAGNELCCLQLHGWPVVLSKYGYSEESKLDLLLVEYINTKLGFEHNVKTYELLVLVLDFTFVFFY